MKLAEHVENIRQLIDTVFRNQLGRMGITATALSLLDMVSVEFLADRKRIELIHKVLIAETGSMADAYEKLVEEFTFTLFNRLAAMKVMEAHTLHPEILTRRSQHGDRSFAHKHWLEQNPDGRDEEMEGLERFLEDQLEALAVDIPLFSPSQPYHLLPTVIELNSIVNAFNQVETDPQVEPDIWQSDDVFGWLYEGYQNDAKKRLKADGQKIEHDKVRIQSCVYTPRWVVKFLVDNSLGKLYLEMFPDSEIKNRYKIANAPKVRIRVPKPLTEIKLIDPATGSGNFLLYAFDLFYDLYMDQIENYGADYNERKIPELIISNNLHGIDLDDRAVQLAQLGLYIKARRKQRSAGIDRFNVVSSDFYLPPYEDVKQIFEVNFDLDSKQKEIIRDIWSDLQQAYKFGSLIRLEEKLSIRLHGLTKEGITLFSEYEVSNYEQFRNNFFVNLQKAVALNTAKQGQTFLNTKTRDAITFLQLLTQKYDVAVANPPYTDGGDFGPELKKFIEANYKNPFKFNSNLYATFIKRCHELTNVHGKMGLIHPLTFMYIKTFEDVRKFIIDKLHINVFVDYGLSNLFGTVMVDPAFYVLEKESRPDDSLFISLDQYSRTPNEKYKKDFCLEALDDYIVNRPNKHNISLPQEKLKIIEGWPFIYWISDGFREKFKERAITKIAKVTEGFKSNNNEKILRHHWEVNSTGMENDMYVQYTKGGKFNKWFGNIWLVIKWLDNGENQIKNGASLTSKEFYFKDGITYTKSGSKGPSFRYLPSKLIFDSGSPSVFLYDLGFNIKFLLAFLNSSLGQYVLNCLNPTVNIQVSDIKKLPIVTQPSTDIETTISALASKNIDIKSNFVHTASLKLTSRKTLYWHMLTPH